MLGKLIKHEWKNVNRVAGVLTLVVVIVTIIGCIMLQLPAMTSLINGSGNMNEDAMVIWFLMGFISFMLYIFMLMGATYGLFIFLGVRFYRTMYTEQGYLTNTLPVTGHQLFISKIFVSGIWYLLLELVVVISVFALMSAWFSGILSGELEAEGFSSMWDFWRTAFVEIGPMYEEIGLDWTGYLIAMVLAVLIAPFSSMTILFGSVTIGQLSKKHKGVMGILAYLGICFLNMIITSVVQVISMVKASVDIMADPYGDINMNLNGMMYSSLIMSLSMAVILYFVSHHILTKKLNMD